jgi:hypothetical protein
MTAERVRWYYKTRRAKNCTPATRPLSGREMRELTPPSAGKPGFPICLRVGRRCTAISAWLLPHDSAGGHRGRSEYLGACPHAPVRLRLQALQRRLRCACDSGVSRSPQHSEYDPLYRLGAAAVQGVFSRLISVVEHRPGRPHYPL